MFTSKLLKLLILSFVAILALVTIGFAAVPKTSRSYPDYALRHPGGPVMPAAAIVDTRGSDYFQRHPELTVPSVIGIGASDYFQRHPELVVLPEASVDQTDYYFRQRSLVNTEPDLTDYYFRFNEQ